MMRGRMDDCETSDIVLTRGLLPDNRRNEGRCSHAIFDVDESRVGICGMGVRSV